MSSPEEYTIGWICALPTEHTAACLFLDEEHGQPDPDHIATGDNNAYELGVMAGHKVVIAVLPQGEYGTTTAATVATDMLRSFPNIKVGLMVGVGGGAPTTNNDIRLGDVVVSSPKDGRGGVYQYDYGKRIQGQDFKPTGHLNQPPAIVLTAMALLASRYERKGNQIDMTVDAILEKNPRLKKKYGRSEIDKLYASDFLHPCDDDCEGSCDTHPSNLVNRRPREEDEDNPAVHFGTIASGNSLMKDAVMRDALAGEGVLCFEMEAAGLANRFPCLVVRGICDYSDTHKNKRWQGYAAMTAAAYTKDLLKVMLPKRVESEKRLTTVLESLNDTTTSIQNIVESTQLQQQAHHLRAWLSPSDPSVSLEKALERRHKNTCRWLLDGDHYRFWRTTPSSFFWLHGLSGCGKTVLASSVIQQLQNAGSGGLVACHYFDVNGGDKRDLSQMLRSLLYQLSSKHSEARQTLQALYVDCGMGVKKPTARQLSEQFTSILDQVAEVTVIIDALDECDSPDDILSWMKDLHQKDRNSLHLLVTSRRQGILATAIEKWPKTDQLHAVRIDGINKDIAAYIHARLFESKEFEKWSPYKGLQEEVEKAVLQRADGMFRLAACQLDELKSCIDRPRLMKALSDLPTTLQGMYARILDMLGSSHCYREALFMLQYLVWQKKPPTFSEMIDALAVRLDESPGFKQENRLFELMDVITECSSLLTPISSTHGREIHLAHSSVKEYLGSQHLVEPFKGLLSEAHARSAIAKTSIKYMIDVSNIHHDSIMSSGKSMDELRNIKSSEVVLLGNLLGRPEFTARPPGSPLIIIMDEGEFPFLRPASHWMEHAKVVETVDDDIPRLVLQLYGQERLSYGFTQILGLDLMYNNCHHNTDSSWIEYGRTQETLIHACYWGLEIVAQRLLESDGQLITSGEFDSPLHAACYSGHHSLVKILLDKGAAVDGCMGASPLTTTVPLHGAVRNGHIEAVKILLQHGAGVDVLGFEDETAIEAAVWYGHRDVVQLLMASCDCFPFHLLFVALSRSMIDSRVVDLLCSKPIVPDSQTTSREFILVLGKLIYREQRAYANLLLEKGAHVSIHPFDPFMQFSDWSSQEDSMIKELRCRDEASFDLLHLKSLTASREETLQAWGTHWMKMLTMGIQALLAKPVRR